MSSSRSAKQESEVRVNKVRKHGICAPRNSLSEPNFTQRSLQKSEGR
ncbi:hypothetical protein A2U01_0071918, partial [Trifolium medium]|nr:hypothetical protein [Trifolium medium]